MFVRIQIRNVFFTWEEGSLKNNEAPEHSIKKTKKNLPKSPFSKDTIHFPQQDFLGILFKTILKRFHFLYFLINKVTTQKFSKQNGLIPQSLTSLLEINCLTQVVHYLHIYYFFIDEPCLIGQMFCQLDLGFVLSFYFIYTYIRCLHVQAL